MIGMPTIIFILAEEIFLFVVVDIFLMMLIVLEDDVVRVHTLSSYE